MRIREACGYGKYEPDCGTHEFHMDSRKTLEIENVSLSVSKFHQVSDDGSGTGVGWSGSFASDRCGVTSVRKWSNRHKQLTDMRIKM